ncbi:hypothetical protein [Lysobacter sp. HA18]
MAPMTYRNGTAAFMWVMTVVWNAMLLVMTWVLLRDGSPSLRSPLVIAAIFTAFWIAGMALAIVASRQACTRVQLFDDGRLSVRQRFPFRAVEHRFAARDRPRAEVVEGKNSDGDPYFTCELHVGELFPAPVRVVEGRRDRCETACRRINDASR